MDEYDEIDRLSAEIKRLRKERDDYLAAIRWALGEAGDFRPRMNGQGPYYWRDELRHRAGLVYVSERGRSERETEGFIATGDDPDQAGVLLTNAEAESYENDWRKLGKGKIAKENELQAEVQRLRQELGAATEAAHNQAKTIERLKNEKAEAIARLSFVRSITGCCGSC